MLVLGELGRKATMLGFGRTLGRACLETSVVTVVGARGGGIVNGDRVFQPTT